VEKGSHPGKGKVPNIIYTAFVSAGTVALNIRKEKENSANSYSCQYSKKKS